jgi:Fur family transcriptional regulator, ferric uptake regulator
MPFDNTTMSIRLQGEGYKLTRPRQAVLQVLAASGEHLSPAEVYARGKAIYPRLGLVTVYRTLEILTDLGLIKRVHLDDGCHTYAASALGHNHHMVCTVCGAVVNFEGGEDLSTLVRRLTDHTGYRINDHWLELFGTCPACQALNIERSS